VEGRWVVDLAILSRVAPPTVHIGVVGYYKSVERHPCPIVIGAAKSIGYWPIDAKEHEKGPLDKHLDGLLRSQILCHEILPPVPGNVLKKFRCGCKT
jgi:hypothetical protein